MLIPWWLLSMAAQYIIVFFCKQKTAYEVRISDWRSDVCSSDLPRARIAQADAAAATASAAVGAAAALEADIDRADVGYVGIECSHRIGSGARCAADGRVGVEAEARNARTRDRSVRGVRHRVAERIAVVRRAGQGEEEDRKSTRLN